MSPERRQQLSEQAKRRHAEGTFGGAKFGAMGGRKPRGRAAKRVAEAAQIEENARQIIEVFKDAISKNQPMSTRLKAAEAWLGIENQESKLALQEEEASAKQHSRDELIAMLTKRLTSGPTSQILRRQIESESGIQDAIVIEDVTDAP